MNERLDGLWPGEQGLARDPEERRAEEGQPRDEVLSPEALEEDGRAPAEAPALAADDLPAEEDELPLLRGPGHLPGEIDVPAGYALIAGQPSGSHRAVGIVVGRFNGEITNRLLEGALRELELAGVARESVTVVPVPGAFELPLAAMALAKTRRFACVVALGCVIRGETPHFEYVAGEAASGLQLAALETGIPVAFGLLTVENEQQAEERIGKAAEAVRGALEMADLFSQLRAVAQG